MGFLDRIISKKDREELDDTAEYGRLLAREADGQLSESEDAKLEGLMARLVLTRADVESHLDVLRRAGEKVKIITALQNCDEELVRVKKEAEKFDAKWTPILAEHAKGQNDLLARQEKLTKDCERKSSEKSELDRLRDAHPIAFGQRPPAPYQPPPQTELLISARQIETEKQQRACQLRTWLRTPPHPCPSGLTPADIELLEYAGSKGWIEKEW